MIRDLTPKEWSHEEISVLASTVAELVTEHNALEKRVDSLEDIDQSGVVDEADDFIRTEMFKAIRDKLKSGNNKPKTEAD